MIGVKFNNRFLTLPLGARMAYEFNNSSFDDTVMQGDYSFPMSCSYKGNAKIFGFDHEMHRSSRRKVYEDSALFFKQIKLYNSIADVRRIEREKVDFSLRLNMSSLSTINTKLRDLPLPTFNLGSDQDTILTTINGQVNDPWTTTPYCFPMIKNPDFYGASNPDFEDFMNNYEPGVGYYKNISTNRNTLVPMNFLIPVLKMGFQVAGYELDLTSEFPSDPLQQKLVIYHNYSLDKLFSGGSAVGMRGTNTVEPAYSQGVTNIIVSDNDSTGDNYDALNAHDNTTGEYTIQAAGPILVRARQVYKVLHPLGDGSHDVFVVHVRKNGAQIHHEILDTYNYLNPTIDFSYAFTATGGDVGSKITITVQYANTVSNSVKVRLTEDNFYSYNDNPDAASINSFRGLFHLNEQTPDITFGDLLSSTKKCFNLAYRFNHQRRTVRIDYWDSLIAQLYKDMGKRSIVSHAIENDNSNVYKLFGFNWAGDDTLLSGNFKQYNQSLSIGSFGRVADLPGASAGYSSRVAFIKNVNQIWRCVEFSAGSYRWEYFTDAWYDEIVDANGTVEVKPDLSPLMMTRLSDDTIYPMVKQTGSSDEFDIGINTPALRLFYYHGTNTDGELVSSTTNIDKNGNDISTTSLIWNTGLKPLWRKRIIIFKNGEWFIKEIQPTLPDLLTFDINDKIRIDNANFLIKQMRGELADSIGPATLTMVKIPDVSELNIIPSVKRSFKVHMEDMGLAISTPAEEWAFGVDNDSTGGYNDVDNVITVGVQTSGAANAKFTHGAGENWNQKLTIALTVNTWVDGLSVLEIKLADGSVVYTHPDSGSGGGIGSFSVVVVDTVLYSTASADHPQLHGEFINITTTDSMWEGYEL